MNTIRCAIVKNGIVINIALCDPTKLPKGAVKIPSNSTVEVGDIYHGYHFSKPEKTLDDMKAEGVQIAQDLLDGTAQAWGYDNIFTACTYADEDSVELFQKEGKALRAWRSLVWAACYQIIGEIQAGVRPIPTTEQFLGLLPTVIRPT